MPKINLLMLLPPVLFIALAALFYTGMGREDADSLPTALSGKQAPAIALTDLGNLPNFTDADLRDGQVKLVNFWASWCAPCRVEHPNLVAVADQGLPVYGVNYKDLPAQNALGFLRELGNPYRSVGADPQGRVALNWGVYGVPETYLLDGQGRIITRLAGPLVKRSFDSTLAPHLQKMGITITLDGSGD